MKITDPPQFNKWGVPTDTEQARRDYKRFLKQTLQCCQKHLANFSPPLAQTIQWQGPAEKLRAHLTRLREKNILLYDDIDAVLCGTEKAIAAGEARVIVYIFALWHDRGLIDGFLIQKGGRPFVQYQNITAAFQTAKPDTLRHVRSHGDLDYDENGKPLFKYKDTLKALLEILK